MSNSIEKNSANVLPALKITLPDFAYEPKYIFDLPSFTGLGLAYIDEPPTTQPNGRIALCLHGEPSWSYLYRKMIPPLCAAGYRVIAPDLFGFGRSDKPTNKDWYTFSRHRNCLLEFINALKLEKMALIVQDWGGVIGLTLPMAMPDRFEQLLVMNTTLATGDVRMSEGFKAWRAYMQSQTTLDCAGLMKRASPQLSQQEQEAYGAPFQYDSPIDSTNSMAGVMQFPSLVPEFVDDDGAALSREAKQFWQTQWTGKSFMAIGMKDPVLGPPVMRALHANIRNCPLPMEVADGGHFLQEWEDGSGNPQTSMVAAALAAWS